MPTVSAGRYLIEYLWEVGPVYHTGAGPAPLPYAEILAWQDSAGIELHPWEIATLRRLSMDYLAESQQATKPDRKAPYEVVDSRAIDAAQVNAKIDQFLS